ncbi:MAG: glucose-6-phosphate dehydrogenase assembly protein OpcA [Opitutaceae bacterium]|nr:glucose-6-phosphate dehydrogenase assembly protein OpcA [Opitutaceae bacterium]
MSDDVFHALPGMEVPVGGIAPSLARLWDGSPADGAVAPSEFRASQMNLVLHLGLPTTPDDGLAQFAAALRFTQRYPARILVLCPRAEGGANLALRAKIYSECFIGSSRREMSCIEAVMLSYPQERRDFLEDQVSIIVEADLPIYYWVHRMSQVSKIATYQWLLRHADRFLLDTAVSTPEARTYAWPRPDGFRDLVQARLLPVRQSVGQFLSAYAPDTIARGLQAVTVAHDGGHAAEGRVLLDWARVRLEACGMPVRGAPSYQIKPVGPGATSSIEVNFAYDDGRYFLWRADFAHGNAYFESTLGGSRQMLPMTTGLLATEAALGEAIFY